MLAKESDGRLFIREAPARLGADKAGLQPGDEVLLIAGRDVRPLSDAELHKLLEGPVGTSVRLTVLRGGEVLHVTVTRTKPPPRPPATQ